MMIIGKVQSIMFMEFFLLIESFFKDPFKTLANGKGVVEYAKGVEVCLKLCRSKPLSYMLRKAGTNEYERIRVRDVKGKCGGR